MSSAVSCIVIKSDRHSQKIPLLGEVVRVEDRSGFFMVMDVDLDSRVVQLMERSGKHRLIDVPFTSILPLKRNLAQVVRRFLDARDQAQKTERRGPNRS